MPFGQLNVSVSTEVLLRKKYVLKSVDLTLDSTEISSWLRTWANILAHHFSSVRPKCFREKRGVNDCYLICQQHGSSRKVTLKSSCGHSMVPTARAYAGVCQEIQTAVSAVELWACLCGEACEFQIQVNVSPGEGDIVCKMSVVSWLCCTTKAFCGGNMLKAFT